MNTASPVAASPAISPSARILRRAFSFPVMLACLLAVLAVLTVQSRFDDPDMWWHLKTGEVIWTTHTIPTADLFSYTTNHHAWVPHEWLSQWLIYGAYKLGGYTGLMFWLCFFTAALLIAGYALCSLYSGNAKVAFLGALILWTYSTVGLAVRPQMIGYLLLILELILLHLGRARSPYWFFALPPLFAVWVNCHGSFFLGILLAGVFLACSFFDLELGSLVSVRWTPRRQKLLGLASLLSVAALFLNPVGIRQILYPLDTMFNQPLSLRVVEEWKPLQLTGARGLGFLALLGGIFLFVLLRRPIVYLQEFALLAMGAWFAAGHERMLFVFGILAAPMVTRLLSGSWDNYVPEQDRPVPNALLIALSVVVLFWAFPSRSSLVNQVEAASPVKAVEFIETHHLSGRMLNDYTYGGYLIWAAPDHPVFIDGRGDVFEWTGVLQDFGEWAMLQSSPTTLLDKYRVDFCLLSKTSPMTHVLPLLPNWRSVYSDNMSQIFVRVPAQPTLQF